MANCLNVLWRRSAFGPCADPRSSAQLAATISDSPYVAAGRREKTMAKGQLKGNKEAKKPKADKSQPKVSISAYKQAQSKGGQAATPFAKKT
jgi:hypothetical protein